jgi:hypothetical protein
MTAGAKPPSEVTWATIERIADGAERDRLAAMSERDIDEELRGLGVDPDDAAELVEHAMDPRRRVRGGIDVSPPERPWRTWVGYAALGVAALLLVVARRPGNWGVRPVNPDDTSSRQAGAAKLRAEAFAACAASEWVVCEIRLDAAQEIDPAGEAAAPVIAARQAIDDSMRAPGGDR